MKKMLNYAFDSKRPDGLLPNDILVFLDEDGTKVDRGALYHYIRMMKDNLKERAIVDEEWEAELEKRVEKSLSEL